MFKEFWQGLGKRSKFSFVVGLLAIVGVTVAVGYWLLRSDYEVLFSGLSPQDATAMTAELDRMKAPYELADRGATILVEKAHLHQTRLKLMSKDIPLHGVVGFELFNKTDFGMTEFAQKVNYQRALQGEITRTILSLAEVESARVHLALPEDSLFKRDRAKPKAAITLALKHGETLRTEQVKGVQRLVAAAVPGIEPQDVTIVDQQGVALTRVTQLQGQVDLSPQLELKREVEQHLVAKAMQVLEKAFGEGQALASVDVTLDMSQVRVTTEDVTGPPVKPGEAVTGVIVRERESSKDETPPLALKEGAREGVRASAGSSSRETEYQVGRRVEQVVTQPGSIRGLQVLAVIKTPLEPHKIEQIRALVAASVGASPMRGDVVVVQSLNELSSGSLPEADPPGAQGVWAGRAATAADASQLTRADAQSAEPMSISTALASLLALVLVAALAVAAARWRRPVALAVLPSQDREALLQQVQQWLGGQSPSPSVPAVRGNER